MADTDYILLRSKDRTSDSSSSSDCTLSFANGTPLEDEYQLVSAHIPTTFYNINSNNNKIYFRENSTSKTATLTNGYYDDSDILTNIDNALTTASAAYATFTVTFDDKTQKITIVSTQNFGLEFATYTSNSAAYTLGFNATDTATNTTTHTSANAVHLFPLAYYINMDGRSQIWNPTQRQNFSFVIPITADVGQVTHFSGAQDFPQIVKFDRNSLVRVRIYDSNYKLIDLNNGDWEILLKKVKCFK